MPKLDFVNCRGGEFLAVLFAALVLGLVSSRAGADMKSTGDAIIMSGKNYGIKFSTASGSIMAINQAGKSGSIIESGEQGIWSVRFTDNSVINASDFSAGSGERSFNFKLDEKANSILMVFKSSEITVNLTVKGNETTIDFTAEVSPQGKTVLDFSIPAALRFNPDTLERFVYPGSGQYIVGMEFNRGFFKLQPQDNSSGWSAQPWSGPQGYTSIYGGPLNQRADNDPPTDLQVTGEGEKWFDEKLISQLNSAKATVNRPPAADQAELILVNSSNGPYFSASHLGGKGLIWRIGGKVGESEKKNALDIVTAVITKLSSSPPAGRNKIGIISLKNGPQTGGWASVKVSEWLERFKNCSAKTRIQTVEITNIPDVISAAESKEFLLILNPYGEWVPAPDKDSANSVLESIVKYVRAGGNWFEAGGYPFYYVLLANRYLKIASSYPNAFADFLHLDSIAGSISVYGVQPQKYEPWEGEKNKQAIFVPGRISCGADEKGGYCSRMFATYVSAGVTWNSPLVQFSIGKSAPEDILYYCKLNEIKRKLEDKVSPQVLDKLKKSMLFFYVGNCKEKLAYLHLIPSPSLIHFSDYLKGGFDKQYPDHLPPHPNFGTPQEFREFFDKAHELGHLVMPYTNPTWWCDHPKGPTFETEGDVPLLRNLDGKLSYERYGTPGNDGYTVCHFHPAVKEANRKTVRQFTEDYPVDVLFQDQCGARGWHYDKNPASPTPYAYIDGLISMVAEDCKTKPLSTEDGWDKVVNYETQLCGMTWKIVPTEPGPDWAVPMKNEIPPSLWKIYPFAQYIAHDKTIMNYHDLGRFVTKRETIPWTLGLGFAMSYRAAASSLSKDAVREWLKWLDRLQKSICARYIGEPVTAFEHDLGPVPSVENDGIIRVTYGPIKIIANIGPKEFSELGYDFPPYGFFAAGPGVMAANLKKLGGIDFGSEGISFVVEGNSKKADAWIYAPQGLETCVKFPDGMSGEILLTFDGAVPVKKAVSDGLLKIVLPVRAISKRVEPPAEIAGKPPRDWQGEKSAIGVLEFEGMNPSWTKIVPGDWIKAFQNSDVFKNSGAEVKSIRTTEELVSALEAGPRKSFAIINPYGELFPVTAAGQWMEMLDKIRNYVNNGGCWWETAGYTFYVPTSLKQNGGWQTEKPVGPGGMGYLGVPVGSGAVDQSAELLTVTAEGREWLGKDLSIQIEKLMSAVNRGLTRGSDDPGHLTLVSGGANDFIGGYRLDGWGWFWRIGGFNPNPDVALPVAVAAMEYIYTHPPLPIVKAGGIKYLWHCTIKTQ